MPEEKSLLSEKDLPVSEYGFPGALRDQLVAAILRGEKTATTSLAVEYEIEGEALPTVGDRAFVIDSDGEPVCIEEIVGVRVARLADVDLEHAIAEGEGFTTVAEWRVGHEGFWHGAEYRAAMGDPTFAVNDETTVVLVQFRTEPLPQV
ncbi:ASCH domain-containing protein [Microbacterium sp. A93]|uniref:ASCH domain-containing protein n=1 Tax=Microbacterium sp. A93 TaxID=3450716 RepID=UPI003F43E2BB